MPLKINMVVVRGMNDDELQDFARLTLTRLWHVRFIEVMPFGPLGEWQAPTPAPGNRLLLATEMRERLAPLGELRPVNGPRGNGPAQIYQLPGAAGTLGFITPMSQHFCAGCNRLRLTADGRLRPCLLKEGEVHLAPALRNGTDTARLVALIMRAVLAKPERHHLLEQGAPLEREMVAIGG